MKVVKFEGTPEEFKVVAHLFSDTPSPTEPGTNGNKSEKEGEKTVDPKEAIRAMLKRRPISDGQKGVYKALADGELSYEDFLKRTGRPGGEMAGVLGALGRRINQTPEIQQAGLPGNVYAVIKYRREDWKLFLSLTPDAEEVLREEKII